MAAPRLKKSRSRTTKQVVPTQVAQLTDKASDGLAAAKEFAKANPWLAAAGGVAVLAVGWSARRLWLPLAATAAVGKLIPGSTSAMSLDGFANAVKQLKPSFMR
jgi:hypothetical protein